MYDNDELIALGRLWHKSCFKCGLSTRLGCGRILSLGKYLEHHNEPFCASCHDENFKLKGHFFGAAVSDSDSSDSNTTMSSNSTLDTFLKPLTTQV